jgi:hypothetical protein
MKFKLVFSILVLSVFLLGLGQGNEHTYIEYAKLSFL